MSDSFSPYPGFFSPLPYLPSGCPRLHFGRVQAYFIFSFYFVLYIVLSWFAKIEDLCQSDVRKSQKWRDVPPRSASAQRKHGPYTWELHDFIFLYSSLLLFNKVSAVQAIKWLLMTFCYAHRSVCGSAIIGGASFLVRVSIAVKRHHDQSISYKGQHLIESGLEFLRFSLLS